MSQPDAPTLGRSTPTAWRARLTGWGLGPQTEAWVTSPADHEEVLAAMVVKFAAEMFPLDAVDSWPRLYGHGGLIQYQLAVPESGEGVIAQVIERVRRSPAPCFLAVLKRLGRASPSQLSVPIEGWTLAMLGSRDPHRAA